jgi:hypothetical protein
MLFVLNLAKVKSLSTMSQEVGVDISFTVSVVPDVAAPCHVLF